MLSRPFLQTLAALHEPASDEQIRAVEATLGFSLPEPFVELLLCSDGLEPKYAAYAISLFGTNALQSMSDAYEMTVNLPSFLFIGFDGGCRGLFLDRSADSAPVYIDTFEIFVPEGLALVSESLFAWIESGFAIPDPEAQENPLLVDVYLLSEPKGGLRGLLHICRELDLLTPVSELRGILQKLPFRLRRSAPYATYAFRIAALNNIDPCLGIHEVDNFGVSYKLPTQERA